MKLAVSNLAWEKPIDEFIFQTLQKQKIQRIEGVLSKIVDWDNFDDSKILDYKKMLDENNFFVESVQSIFYNSKVNSLSEIELVVEHFKKLIRCCQILGVKIIVLGSPQLRKKVNQERIFEVFKILDLMLSDSEIFLVIEPNSKIYGGDYFFTLREIIEFLELGNFKNIQTMIDTHNLILENLDPIIELKKNFNRISHIHISEKNLLPITEESFHQDFSKTLKMLNYKKIVTYEFKPSENFIQNLETFTKLYS